jgi:hypothetical protein
LLANAGHPIRGNKTPLRHGKITILEIERRRAPIHLGSVGRGIIQMTTEMSQKTKQLAHELGHSKSGVAGFPIFVVQIPLYSSSFVVHHFNTIFILSSDPRRL